MGTLTDYFDRIGHKPQWHIGDRVFGVWNDVPFIGSVGSESLVDPDFGPRVTVLLDLPIRLEDRNCNVVVMKPAQLKRLKNYD